MVTNGLCHDFYYKSGPGGSVGDTAQESLFEAGPLENLFLVCEEVLGLLHQAI